MQKHFMYKDDLTRVQHIIDAGNDAIKFLVDKKREDLGNNSGYIKV